MYALTPLLWVVAFPQPTPVPAYREAKTVAVLSIEGEVDSITASSFKRRLEEAKNADALVIDLNTPGGGLLPTLDICYEIKNNAPANTVAWIHPHAFSAGTIIALACREIIAAPNSTFGDAAPVTAVGPIPATERAKIESPILTEVVDSARRNHYDEHLVESFVSVGIELWLLRNTETNELICVNESEYRTIFGKDPPKSFSPIAPEAENSSSFSPFFDAIQNFTQSTRTTADQSWEPDFAQQLPQSRPLFDNTDSASWELVKQIVPNDRLLTLKPKEAEQYGLIKGIVADDGELTKWFGATTVYRLDTNWSEKLVRILVSWPIRILLIALFLICIFVEFVTGSSGAFSIGATVSLALLIGAPWLAGLANFWEVIAIVAGLVCIATELLLIPGVGVVGFIGIACLFIGIIGTFISEDLGSAEGQAQLLTGLGAILGGGILAAIASWFIVRYLGGASAMQRLVLEDTIEQHTPPFPPQQAELLQIGQTATAMTDLRPSGRIQVENSVFDAVTTGQWIAKGATVRIMHTGMTIEVEEVSL
ncbi:MAG: hypothetical protein QGI78_00050 [Phycisphaerales bacterium]|jgi:membrane-bound ClpP family serine protease|nr:hypothetical protein [Phycisphaerales bacterium]